MAESHQKSVFGHCFVSFHVSRWYHLAQLFTVQKMKFSIKDFFIKCDQIRSFLRIWSHLLKTCFIENFTFCAVAYSEAYSVAYTEAYSAQYQTSLIELFLRKYVTAKGFTEKSISRQIFLCKIRTLVFRTWLNIYDRAFCENSF